MPIRKLPPLLVNQIAAGEVIERPASVVKELIENSLDARAGRIEVAVEAGGHRLIRVSDDGRGIGADELRLAVAPHATSKLRSAEDLAAIQTLGFRGEALASIASVSRLRLSSRPSREGRVADAAAVIEASGDQVSPPKPAAGSPGTVVEVRDLFYNTPARRKFMRTAQTEIGHISETINRISMVHHTVAFGLMHNGKRMVDLAAPSSADASGSRRRRCVDVLGKDIEEALLEFEHSDTPDAGAARVWGMAGMPELARASSKFQYLCVNGRPVKDRNLAHAVREAYRGLIPLDRLPVAVVFIELDPAGVDVNVHPTKAEVRFRNPNKAHGLVLTAIRQRLLGSDLTPDATLGAPPLRGLTFTPPPSLGAAATGAGPASPDDFVDFFRRMGPAQKGFVYQQVKDAFEQEAGPSGEQAGAVDPASEGGQGMLADPGVERRQILQVHNSFLVTQDDSGAEPALIIVDQHALHERVMFEQLRRRVFGAGDSGGSGGRLESQRLLTPAIIEADDKRQALLDELRPLLERIGVEAEPIGPAQVAVQAFPTFLFDRKVEPASFLTDLLDTAEDGGFDLNNPDAREAALHEVLDMMSCKAAVKAGDAMSEQELSALLAQRDQIERAGSCPHGRPTTVRLTLRELEKQFKRT